MNKKLVLALSTILISLANADQGSFTNSGGSTSASSTAVIITSNVTSPAGTLTLNCLETSETSSTSFTCSGGSFAFSSADGSSSISASFTSSSTYTETCVTPRFHPRTCSWTFTGYFSGTLTRIGEAQAINGVTYQAFADKGGPPAGTTAYNSAYTPFYYSDSGQILRSDDLHGTNQITYGTQGSGAGHFYGAYGIALDATGRIYVADTYNCRVVRIDNMHGANWTTYGGTCGSGQGQFSDPYGIAVDLKGTIYIMDTGNSRIVSIDDMKGTNWKTYGSPGSGVGQFASPTSIALNPEVPQHIYVADAGNLRIVRFDDMSGTNWTTLTKSQPINGVTYSFQAPTAVAVDSSGKIYVADDGPTGAVIRVNNMTGAGWTGINLGPQGTSGANSISVDGQGMVFAGGGIGGGVKVVDGLAVVRNSSGAVAPSGSSYVFGITAAPVSSPPPPAIMPLPNSLSFANQNVGTISASQPVQITNFGGHPLDLSITASNGFVDRGCPAVLNGGSSCTISVSFAPKVAGPTSGSLTLLDNSGNLGSKQTVLLNGLATAPVSYAAPGSLTFRAQLVGVPSAAQSVVLLNTGTGPLYVKTVSATAPFSQTNNCNPPSGIVPGAACTILVSFKPTAAGSVGGTLTITSNAATQSVNLSGAGSATAPTLTASPASLLFPEQQLNIKSASQSVTISNTSKTAVTIKSLSVTGDFKTSNCTSVAAGGTCTVSVTFTPTATGTRTGTLTIDFATGAQAAVALTGIGSNGSLPGVLSLSPSPLTFNGYTIGDNPSQTVTVTNTSGAATGIQRVFMSGNPSLSAQSQCGPVLAPLATCSITVTFQPTAYGTFTSTLTVVGGSGAKDTVSVTGNSAPDS